MNPVQAIVLGVVQGLTEFFPVSSSGHLVIFQYLFGFKEPAVLFDISVHVGTLLAVMVYFYADIVKLFQSLFRFLAAVLSPGSKPFAVGAGDPELRMVGLIAAGTIPTGILGFGFHKIADQLFASLLIVGVSLFCTAGLLLGTRLVKTKGRSIMEFTVYGALMVGIAQGLAVIPGISRSGATIAVCLLMGLNRDMAARFSFLLAIPAILGALLLSLASAEAGGPGELLSLPILLGTVTSAGVGYLALASLVRIVRHGRLFYFAPYCVLLGLITLALHY